MSETQHPTQGILRTKLHRPPVGPDMVRRVRLLDRMGQGLATPLTLVSAPAGYGKSMLVSQWAETVDQPNAWLSLDDGDSDLRRFLQHFLAAIESLFPGACQGTEVWLTATDLPPARLVADRFMNELDALDRSFIIVLDDYHRIERDSPVHDFMSRFLEFPPPGVHLVLITRRDPSLSLYRLRADYRVNEIRQRDLRFSQPESAQFLSQSVGPPLSAAALQNLQEKVEGWAVGLRLLSMALRYSKDADLFLREMGEGLPHMQEYLLREVLSGLPPEIQSGMLRASLLNRFCEELLDAVCMKGAGPASAEGRGSQLLERLQGENLFTIRLDAQGKWFRYHHLFQDLLLTQLQETVSPAEMSDLHGEASAWFESEGFVTEAIQHALAAGKEAEAAAIVERHRKTELDADRWHVVERWLDLLPREIREQRPALLLGELWSLYERFQHDRMLPILDRVEVLLEAAPDDELLGELLFFRGSLEYWSGKGESSLRLIEKARALLPKDRKLVGGLIEIYRGLTACMTGQKDLAVQGLNDRVAENRPHDPVYESRLFAGLHFVNLLSADLLAGRKDAKRLHSVARKGSIAYTEVWGSYMEACTDLHTFDLERACEHFGVTADQRYIFNALAATDGMAGLVLACQLRGEEQAAVEASHQLDAFARELQAPLCLSVAESSRARLALLQGDLASAAQWAHTTDHVPGPAELWIWLEVPAITQARVLVALGTSESLAQAAELLVKIRERTEAWHFTCQTIEVAVLQALAQEGQGKTDEALATLKGALALSGPGGWVRSFVEAGPRMWEMLRTLGAQEYQADFIRRILAATEGSGLGYEGVGLKGSAATTPPESLQASQSSASGNPQLTDPRATGGSHQNTLDSLTNREIDVLDLLAQRLRSKEIASRLFISTHTVNDHLKRTYRKLGVSNRRQAVERAIALGVITGPTSLP